MEYYLKLCICCNWFGKKQYLEGFLSYFWLFPSKFSLCFLLFLQCFLSPSFCFLSCWWFQIALRILSITCHPKSICPWKSHGIAQFYPSFWKEIKFNSHFEQHKTLTFGIFILNESTRFSFCQNTGSLCRKNSILPRLVW